MKWLILLPIIKAGHVNMYKSNVLHKKRSTVCYIIEPPYHARGYC